MIKILFFLFALLPLQVLKAQSDSCSQLRNENIFLKNKLKKLGIDLNDTTSSVKSYSPDITINYIKCIGNRKTQTVTIFFNVSNTNLPNQIFTMRAGELIGLGPQINPTKAIDEVGKSYTTITASLGAIGNMNFTNTTPISTQLITQEIPTLASISFSNILPNISLLKSIQIWMNNQNEVESGRSNYKFEQTIFKNISIKWE